MPTAFTDDADFSGFTRDEPPKISEVLHEAFVAVDEQGTEAAAATAVVMQRAAALRSSVPFVVDRPPARDPRVSSRLPIVRGQGPGPARVVTVGAGS